MYQVKHKIIIQIISNFSSVEVSIYTDGASRGNPGPGGYGIVMLYGKHRLELSQGYTHTTNNRMELLAIIVALETLKKDKLEVHCYTDSKYVVDAVEKKWVFGWVKKNFKGKKNPDLWKRFLELYPKNDIHMHWIKGHNNHPLNERCDELAVDAALSDDLLVDEGYMKSIA